MQNEMQNQINQLTRGSMYQFNIGDNNTTHVGQFERVDGDNLIFIVDGRSITYPISIISGWQRRHTRPGFDPAFVRIPNGGNRKSRKCRKSRKSRKSRKCRKCRKCRKPRSNRCV